ncbi:FAD-dependent oxidoreductase [Nocardioides sp. AE5]|uniref:FAD-dependent oxidoreductase n=1 Tax=Nocardioides sp. AE5 TaxID=2962573 RepID=UPI0028828B84|nr:FAD-dependent oxidoreductase [Nocardioides sp. AE5]MDT0202123.1 FAD-dependent oxidoreductase [Nocardioides sp. AE5]
MAKIKHPHLMSPGRIGPMSLANRVVLPAMDMNVCVDGEIHQADIDHYAARARGGAGLVITGASAVAFPVGAASTKEPGLSDDRFLPGLTALADAIHAAGGKLCVQSTHHGKVARIDTLQDRPLLVPSEPDYDFDLSALADNTSTELRKMAAVTGGKQASYHAATAEDVAWLVETWADAADRVRRSGADAIEIHCAHGYILGAFLNQRDNRRTDDYGGSLENRARLACEVIRAVSDRVGDQMAVIVRVAGQEYGQEGGLTLAESCAAAVMFEAAGADAIHVTGWGRNPFSNFTDGPLPDKVGAYADLAAEVKKHVSIPVIAVGRMLPDVAEKAIAEGRADFAAMGRQLLADPDLPNKLGAGRHQDVRPCINCYVCVQENFWDDTPLCAVNPALGNEALVPFVRTTTPKHVAVVGAGPAGLESARVLTERGHRVTVLDKADRLGGTLWFSTLTTPANEQLLDWLTVQVKQLGIDVRLRTEADRATVAALAPDHVVVATGAQRPRPEVPGGDLPHVHTGDSLRNLLLGAADAGEGTGFLRTMGKLGRATGITRSPEAIRKLTRTWLPIGKDVVVIGGSLVGLELAEWLAERGRTVTLLEEGRQLGLPMAMPRRWTAVRAAGALGVTVHRKAVATRITAEQVEFTVDGEAHAVAADAVVYADKTHAAAPLAGELAAAGVEHTVLGDAAEVGYIEHAMHSAWEFATTF